MMYGHAGYMDINVAISVSSIFSTFATALIAITFIPIFVMGLVAYFGINFGIFNVSGVMLIDSSDPSA